MRVLPGNHSIDSPIYACSDSWASRIRSEFAKIPASESKRWPSGCMTKTCLQFITGQITRATSHTLSQSRE